MKLPASLIVKNESSCLAKCLSSIVGVDELIVVDTGSTDNTKEIAASFGANLYDFSWIDDFAAARNFSLSKCTGDFVLIIDADEVLEPGGLGKIREAIAAVGNWKTIYVRAVSTGGILHHSPRVFKRCPEVYWKGAVHNYIVPVEDSQKSNPIDVQITYGYSEAHKLDPDRQLRILTKVLEENPKAVRETYYLAREYWDRKDYVTAAKWYQDYLSRATWAAEMADAWLMLAYCLWNIESYDLARDACLQAIKINTNFKEALVFMAKCSGPKNKAAWSKFAELATNEDVLFVRS